jgi:hypothetical protein
MKGQGVCLCMCVLLCVQVGPEEARALSGSLAQAELLKTLQLSLVTPEPSSLLHLHVHIRTQQSNSRNPSLAITCHAVHPGSCTLTPVHDLPIVHTALARNLAGPVSLPVLQDTVKWGYVTMEVTRKLVLLLNSDPKSLCVPLVGVVVCCLQVGEWCQWTHPSSCVGDCAPLQALCHASGEGGRCRLVSSILQ